MTIGTEGHPLKGQVVRCRKCLSPQEKYRSLNIPVDRADSTFENFNLQGMPAIVKRAHASAMRFAEKRDPPWRLFTGPVGCGKTYLLYSTALRLSERHFVAPVRTAGSIIGQLQLAIGDEHQELEKVILDFSRRKDPLIIDEWGLRESPAAMSWWERILGYRYEELLPTFLVANAPPSDVQRLSLRLFSRFSDKSICDWVDMKGAGDYRQRR